MSFINELKRRNVVRMALLYAVASWVVLQIADVLFEPLGVPPWAFRLVLGLLLIGFPFALIFSWVFELTPTGLKRTPQVDPAQSTVQQSGQRMNLLIVLLLVIAIAGVVADRFIPESSEPAATAVAAKAAGEAANAVTDVRGEPAGAENTIAVLPFVNMSGDPENEYFSDGLSEELMNTLVRIGGLRVTGRTSSFAFKGENRDLREIGSILNVAHVLEGSVRKAGKQVRITAQLIKTSDGYHLWSDTFDRELNDIFAIQEEIAGQVTQALQVTLLGEGTTPDPSLLLTNRDPKAYEEFLRGMYIFQRDPDGLGSLERATEHYKAALAIDPEYVDALWGMFQVSDRMNRNGHGPFPESLQSMNFYVGELEQLAPGSDRALGAGARLAVVDFQYERALQYLEEVAMRFPASVPVLGEYANTLSILKQYEKAIQVIDRTLRLDPLSLETMRWKSWILHRAGDCEGVEEVMHRAMEIEPKVGRFRYYSAMCTFETTGDAARALPYAEAEPLGFLHDTALAIFYEALGDQAKAQQALDRMLVKYGDSASYQYGQVHAQWGDVETALGWLEQALEIRDPGIIQAGDDRLLIPLRDEPRFQRILKAAGHL